MSATGSFVVLERQGQARGYRQWPLFSALIHDIMQGELEREQSADDITGILLLHAKTIVDSLDA